MWKLSYLCWFYLKEKEKYLTNEFFFFYLSHSFSLWSHFDSEDPDCDFFFIPSEQPNQTQIFCLFVYRWIIFAEVKKPHATEMKGTMFFNEGKFKRGQIDPKVRLRVNLERFF